LPRTFLLRSAAKVVGGCCVRREAPGLTIEPSAGSFMMMGGFSVM